MQKIICDMCGKEFDTWDKEQKFKLNFKIGYGSKYDTKRISCDFCNDCLDKLLDEYLIPKCTNPIIKPSWME